MRYLCRDPYGSRLSLCDKSESRCLRRQLGTDVMISKKGTFDFREVGYSRKLRDIWNPWISDIRAQLGTGKDISENDLQNVQSFVGHFQIRLLIYPTFENLWIPKFQVSPPVPNRPWGGQKLWIPKFQISPPVPNSLKLKVLFCTTCMPIPNINTNIMIGIILPSLIRLCILLIFQQPSCGHYSRRICKDSR